VLGRLWRWYKIRKRTCAYCVKPLPDNVRGHFCGDDCHDRWAADVQAFTP
jgi:hypothetical protein